MPELRKDPITGRWVIIATEQAKRPGDFRREQVIVKGVRLCPFCPGNELRTPPELLAYRNSGAPNEPGWSLRVVANKFPVLRVEGELNRKGDGIYDRMNGVGAHEVIIESAEHMQTFATLPEKRIEDLFWAYRDRVVDLRRDSRLRHVILFKNHGEAAGQSIEHTHSQLIALPVVPKRVQEEIDGAKRYLEYRDRCVFCDINHQEIEDGSRLILESNHFVVIAPYASRFAFEICIVPKAHQSHAETMAPEQMQDLGQVVQRLLRKVDAALERPAYHMVLHSAPIQDLPLAHYHWHIELIPKLTHVDGFEWGSEICLNPTAPEEAAKFLRDSG